jgi:CDP-glucose 4,6-dehydratase
MALVNANTPLSKTFSGKKVFVTGNTGFKGSWLSLWLEHLGANVFGYSNKEKTQPSMFENLEIEKCVKQFYGDISDRNTLLNTLKIVEPDFIFHLAAQSIVSASYLNPLETIKTNSLGTATLLDVLVELEFAGTAVMITSDKCYENDERKSGYREDDRLGGRDPYSASKAAAEIFLSTYVRSFFRDGAKLRIGIARAGNVIGGGDWNENRIVVDCVKAWLKGERVSIRNPEATRPWQHVLEPLSGYLSLAQKLYESPDHHGHAFNFGPDESNVYTVSEVVYRLGKCWGFEDVTEHVELSRNKIMHEASLLSLNCEKATKVLSWSPRLEIDECLTLVADWYIQFGRNPNNLLDLTIEQIKFYESKGSLDEK